MSIHLHCIEGVFPFFFPRKTLIDFSGTYFPKGIVSKIQNVQLYYCSLSILAKSNRSCYAFKLYLLK